METNEGIDYKNNLSLKDNNNKELSEIMDYSEMISYLIKNF
jgi:hypothetical protein